MNFSFTLLDLYLEWGVDCTLSEKPLNRLEGPRFPPPNRPQLFPNTADRTITQKSLNSENALKQKHTPPLSSTSPAQPLSPLSSSPSTLPIQQAITLAQNFETPEALLAFLPTSSFCPLSETATHTVVAILPATPTHPKLLIIGDAPSDEEDLTGRAFAGKTGSSLAHVFSSIGIELDQTTRMPLIPWRPPGGRKPTPYELTLYKPFLYRFITLLKPDFIVTLGHLPAQILLNSSQPFSQLRGQWHTATLSPMEYSFPLFSFRHPLQVARSPKFKKELWEDLKIFFTNFSLNS
ncbi:uracil-DNA glycosylase [Entomobacter blattae]|uniref:Uracil DNA glycosylase superfamily protein n=1 Tax=Entomobacter blattae TaxID=2762277 RepID=A0A7H1NPZ9_9PROT|nr:uracil-DNA glycosylase [Entomobacter blattae]QNT77859.1 Uracil DNA glycosylase superfamily protein [Entomobacter blattae]